VGHTITVRLSQELAEWLQESARKAGVPQGRIVRDQLEKARAASRRQAFLKLAGSVRGARDLSLRKGFSRP